MGRGVFEAHHMDDILSRDPEDVFRTISTFGIVTFSLRGDNLREELSCLGAALGRVRPHPHSDADGATTIAPRPGTDLQAGQLGFSREHLPPHTDASAMELPPDLLLNVCATPAARGGEALLVDMRAVLARALQLHPGMFERLLTPGSAIFGTPGHTRAGSVFELCDGRVHVRFRQDDGMFFNATVLAEATALLGLVDAMTVQLHLERGQGYIVDNHWWLHGRTRFDGPREVIRILADVASERADGVPMGGFPWQGLSALRDQKQAGAAG